MWRMIRSAKDFGALIRLGCKRFGCTQAELAARARTGERFIIELEAGKPSCQLRKVLTVARTVGLELEDFRRVRLAPSSTDSDDDLGFPPTFSDGE